MRHYNTWLFPEVSTRCLHQITRDKAIIDGKRGNFAQNFQFSIKSKCCNVILICQILSTDSDLEIANPSHVRAHTKSSLAQKTKEKRKRDHSSSIDAETRAKQPQNADFYNWKKTAIQGTCNCSSREANAKFREYFDEECGLHPARNVIYDSQFLNPKTV